MDKMRVWVQGGAVLALLILALFVMRAVRAPTIAEAGTTEFAPTPGSDTSSVEPAASVAKRASRATTAAASQSASSAATRQPSSEDKRSDEQVLANYTKEELENSGLTTQSMFYRQQSLAYFDILEVVNASGGEALTNHVKLVAQGLSYAAMPGIKSDPAKVLLTQKQTLDRIQRELGSQLDKPLRPEGPTLRKWLAKAQGDLQKMSEGRGPSSAEAVERAEQDYSVNGDTKAPKDDDEPDDKPDERAPAPFDDAEDNDEGNIYAPISPAVQRSLQKQADDSDN